MHHSIKYFKKKLHKNKFMQKTVWNKVFGNFNPGPAEPRYALQKPTDMDLHCFDIKYVNLYQQLYSSNLIA